jgi:hypothetical protein
MKLGGGCTSALDLVESAMKKWIKMGKTFKEMSEAGPSERLDDWGPVLGRPLPFPAPARRGFLESLEGVYSISVLSLRVFTSKEVSISRQSMIRAVNLGVLLFLPWQQERVWNRGLRGYCPWLKHVSSKRTQLRCLGTSIVALQLRVLVFVRLWEEGWIMLNEHSGRNLMSKAKAFEGLASRLGLKNIARGFESKSKSFISLGKPVQEFRLLPYGLPFPDCENSSRRQCFMRDSQTHFQIPQCIVHAAQELDERELPVAVCVPLPDLLLPNESVQLLIVAVLRVQKAAVVK